jgi:hypothetical protein
MNKTKLLIANIKGNMKLEGMSVSQATINVIEEISNSKLSSAQKILSRINTNRN